MKGGVDSSRKGGRSRRQRGLVAEGEVNGFPVAVKVDNNAEPAVLYIANLQPGKGSTSPWTQAAGRLIQKWTASAPGTFELVAVKNSEGWIQLDQPLNIPVNPGSLQKTLNRP